MKKFLFFLAALILFPILFLSCVSETEDVRYSGFDWLISSPEAEGLNPAQINTAFQEAEKREFIYAVVIIRHGKIAAEKYFAGRNFNNYQTIRSVSKSFLSALYGIAVEKGMLRLDQKLIDFFPEYKASITDQRINNITIDHLIKMRAGFKGDEEFYFTFTYSSDWINTILSSTLIFDPGSKMGYSTAGTHLLSAILTKASGMSTLEFAEKNLFNPAGIIIKGWVKDPQGYYFGGNDMYFTPRDMAVIGQLYLNLGKLNGIQIVPEEWVKKSTVSYSGASSGSWGKLSKYGYGYLWWIGEVGSQNIFTALGHGGQYVLCIPSFDMVVAVQSYPDSDWNQADFQERAVLDIIADYIIPAVL